jgi:hypothetical protein
MDIYSQPGARCAHPSGRKVGIKSLNMNSSSISSNFQKLYDAEVAKTTKKDDPLIQATDKKPKEKMISSVGLDSKVSTNFFQSFLNQVNTYKQEQLRLHLGGDNVSWKNEGLKNEVVENKNIFDRITKDGKDGLANFGNFFKDFLWGSDRKFVDDAGQVKTMKKTGLLGNLALSFKDLASGLSFGKYFSDDKSVPQGIIGRTVFSVKKLFQGAIFNDIVYGMPSSAINLLDDAALGVWNLMEVVPDATLGNIPGGHKLVTTIFDNGQVAIDYITDCLPTGEAWMRVHGFQVNGSAVAPPLLFNLTLPERYAEDSRWSTVQNTPFRKTIETIGSLLADFGLTAMGYNLLHTSQRRN